MDETKLLWEKNFRTCLIFATASWNSQSSSAAGVMNSIKNTSAFKSVSIQRIWDLTVLKIFFIPMWMETAVVFKVRHGGLKDMIWTSALQPGQWENTGVKSSLMLCSLDYCFLLLVHRENGPLIQSHGCHWPWTNKPTKAPALCQDDDSQQDDGGESGRLFYLNHNNNQFHLKCEVINAERLRGSLIPGMCATQMSALIH